MENQSLMDFFKKNKELLYHNYYSYEVGGHYCLRVKFNPKNKYFTVQVELETDYHDSDNYDDDKWISVDFSEDKLDSVIQTVKKGIIILDKINENFKQVIICLDNFRNLEI